MTLPVTTPCAHNFCKSCLEGAFAGKAFVRQRGGGGRTLRAQKNVMLCPHCPTDISDFLQDPKVNREVMALIESLQRKTPEENGDGVEEEEVVEEEEEARGSDENPNKRIKVDEEEKKEGDDEAMKVEMVEEVVAVDGNNSPSSPLHVPSSEDE